MISKLCTLDAIFAAACDHSTCLYERRSGDSTGRAMQIIGDAMCLDKPYTVKVQDYVEASDNQRQRGYLLLDKVDHLIKALALKHFEIDTNNQTVTYNIWRS